MSGEHGAFQTTAPYQFNDQGDQHGMEVFGHGYRADNL